MNRNKNQTVLRGRLPLLVLPLLLLTLPVEPRAEPMASMESVMGEGFTPRPDRQLLAIPDPQRPRMEWEDWKGNDQMTGDSVTGGTVRVSRLDAGYELYSSPSWGATLPDFSDQSEPDQPSHGIVDISGYHILNGVSDSPLGQDGKRSIRCLMFLNRMQTDVAFAFEYNSAVRIPQLNVPGEVALSCRNIGDGALIALRDSALHNFRRQANGSIAVTYTTFQ